MEIRGLRYVFVGLVVGAIFIMAITLSQIGGKQAITESYMDKLQVLIDSTPMENEPQVLIDSPLKEHIKEPVKFRDLGASPVYSAFSELDKELQGQPDLPDIIELDYKPVQFTRKMNHVQREDAIIRLSLQRQVVCRDWEMYGVMDGEWPVCKAKALIPTQPCLVYSFGIRNDWSFDDAYRKAHGCIIRTFDPSMGTVKEHEHSPGVFFYPIGLSDKKGKHPTKAWNLDTYKGLLTRFKEENRTIPYVKFDIEGMEWIVLDNMMSDGLLKNVKQLSFELHVRVHLGKVRQYFNLLKRLEGLGFRRWFYHHRLNGFSLQVDQSFINMNFLK